MPIYAYRCESCNQPHEVLQKISDSLLTQCPACGQDTLRKQLTAAGFQLKGSGWYVTDFRDQSKASETKQKNEAKPSGESSEPAKAAAGLTESAAAPASVGAPTVDKATQPPPALTKPS